MSYDIRRIVSHWRQRLFPKKTLGQRGEEAAARYLRRKRYKILARSHRFRLGELDLVALDGRTIVFVEVKTRESAERRPSLRSGGPAQAAEAHANGPQLPEAPPPARNIPPAST